MNSTFIRRLKFYGIGFGAGILFILFFFENRGCSWLPENRVKNSILERVLVISEKTQQKMARKNIRPKDIVEVLNDGEVVFGEGNRREKNKYYQIEKNGNKYYFLLPRESFISEVFLDNPNQLEVTRRGSGKMIHFPNDKYLVYIEEDSLLLCQQKSLGIKDGKDVLQAMKENAFFNFEKTNFKTYPKPVHSFSFTTKEGTEVKCKAIWYKNKINVTSLSFKGDICNNQ